MKSFLRSLTVSAVICGLALPLAAAQKENKKKTDKPAAAPAAMYKLPETVALTEEQKPKLEAINKEYTPKFQALGKKGSDLLTKEQKTARREAQKAGKDAGKKQKEIQADVEAAMMLSDEQKKQTAEVKTETTKLKAEMETKVVALLTDEQKTQVEDAKKKAGKKNKKAAKNS